MATNLSLNHLSRYRARWRFFSELRTDDSEFVDDQPAPEVLEQSLAEADDRRWLESAIHQLPAAQRVPLVLYHFQDRSYEEIAATLGISLAKVKTDIHRARQALRKIVLRAGLSELGANRCAPVSRRATRRRENPLAASPCGPPCNDSRIVCRPVSHLIPHALVPMEPDPRLEHFIDEQLRRLPAVTAPLTLLTRVYDGHRHPRWVAVVETGVVALAAHGASGGAGRSLVGGRPGHQRQFGSGRGIQPVYATHFRVDNFGGFVSLLASLCLTLTKAVEPFLVPTLLVALTLYLLCMAFATALVRVASKRN